MGLFLAWIITKIDKIPTMAAIIAALVGGLFALLGFNSLSKLQLLPVVLSFVNIVGALFLFGANYFSLKNITASKTEKNTSPFAISAASDALACVNPTKYKLGAITAPQTVMDIINKRSLFVNFCFCFCAKGLKVIADMM